MAQVQVTGTARLRCRNATGQYYTETRSVTGTGDDEGPGDPLRQILFLALAGDIPDNCTGISWEIDNVTPVDASAEDVDILQETSVYIYVYIECDGRRTGPYTRQVDVPIGTDVSEFNALAQAVADSFMQVFLGGGFGLDPPFRGDATCKATWTIAFGIYYKYLR